VKRASALRTGPTTYAVRWGKLAREGVPYRFLLALCAGGYTVRLSGNGWGKGKILKAS
jgi:hypothetical protein